MVDVVMPPPSPTTSLPTRGRKAAAFDLPEEASADERAAQRRAARRVFRVYCFACGRSTDSLTRPAALGRCPTCGGTMMVEWAAD